MKPFAFVAMTVLVFASSALRAAEVPTEKQAEITKMLKITGVEKMMTQMMSQMMATFKSKDSSVSSAFWDKLEAGMDAHSMIDKLIPIYDKYYSLEDLKAVNAFYATTAGQHLLTTMPQVMQESMVIGQQWGQETAQKVSKAMEAEKEKKGK
ncbi:MAG: hypothetical protein JWO94_1914 [Verrucomicrobiaceae bacterium]|nr:hypothetical protein [Verrucomicrobiaceae bacterium]